LKYTPFWSAVRIISGTVAELPFLVYRRLGNDDRQRAPEHPVYTLLHDRPNEYMDALTFIESRQAHVLTYGNGYAEIQRDGAGRPIALWPLLPDRTFRKISENGMPYYEVRPQTGETVYLPDYNVLHIKGLGFDGLSARLQRPAYQGPRL
jgi:HK97 family phage portal protein